MKTSCKVTTAVINAKEGIQRYVEIMDRLGRVDVSVDREFQRLYNGFYRVRQRKPSWYEAYYGFMEKHKNLEPSFDEVLDFMRSETGRYEPSFSSKLVATLSSEKPVWDSFVLRNTGLKAPPYHRKTRFTEAKECYINLESWYRDFLKSDEALEWISVFDQLVPEQDKLTALKKVDFVLWKVRD